MKQNKIFRNLLCLAMLGMSAQAGAESTDAETRIKALEKQLQALSQELAAMQQQMAGNKEEKIKAQGKSTGTPVLASFKDGITFEDGSGNWKMAINGRVQADYRQFSPDEDAADTFSLRRARLGATMTFYKDYAVRVEGEYSGSSTSLTYGYLDINTLPKAKIRIGQFKPTLGLERTTSTNFLDFQERSMADALLSSSYDRGIMMHGAPFAGTTYSVAYVNGSGSVDETNAKNDGKDVIVRLTGNVAEMAGWKDSILHVGGFYADGNQGSRNQSNFIPGQRTEGRGLTFFATENSNAFNQNVDRTRSGLEAIAAYGPFKLQGEYIRTEFEGDGFERDMSAWYAGAMWNITGEKFAASYQSGVMSRLRPNQNFKTGADGWGAWQAGIRYSRFDASDFSAGNDPGTGVLLSNPAGTSDGLLVATNEADAWTVGVNWILNPNIRLVANLTRTNYDTPVLVRVNGENKKLDKEDALTMRAQFDF
jgi:phosphate-selective porin OprO/OprP